MAETFAVLDALNQSAPTNFDAVDANMMFKSDETRVATAMDSKLFVRFFTKAVKNEEKSREANRAIFEQHEFVNIKIPGDKNNDVVKDLALEPFYIQRFPVQYARFKKNMEQVVGTPLSAVPFLNEAQVEEYKSMNIRTVEQLAGLADVNAQTILGSVKHKQEAQAFLDSFKSADALRAEFEAKDKAQTAALAAMQAQLDALTKTQANQTLHRK